MKPFLWALRFINLVTERDYLLTCNNSGIVELILADTVYKNKSLIFVIAVPDSLDIFRGQFSGSRSHVLVRTF